MHLLTRLARLEKNAPRQPPRPCATCGAHAAGASTGAQKFTCEFEDGSSRENDFCRECGRQLVFHIEFDKGG